MKPRGGVFYSDFYLTSGARIRKSLGTSDRALATLKEREMQVAMEAALREPAKALPGVATASKGSVKGMTLDAAFKRAKREWEPWRDSKSPETIEANFRYVTEHFKAHSDLAAIDRDALLDYTEELREQGKSASTINQRLSLLSVLMKVAERPTGGVVKPFKMPRQKPRPGRIRVLPYAEEARVVEWFSSPDRTIPRDKDMADLVVFLVDTGFRLSEALRVRSPEVDWENELVPAWENKADHPRQVPMTDRVKAILKKREKLEYPFGMFSKDYADDRWEAMRKALKYDLKKDPEFVIHALRHTCASRLAAAGEDAFRIQKWMGHKNITTTQKYVTLFAKDLKGLASTLNKRHQEAIQKKPLPVPSGVPKSVPKTPYSGTVWRTSGLARRRSQQGIPPEQRTGESVGAGLLIRRSLVRAQVGEPVKIDQGLLRKAFRFCAAASVAHRPTGTAYCAPMVAQCLFRRGQRLRFRCMLRPVGPST